MQISAANLLLAAQQQPKPATPNAPASFSGAMAAAKAPATRLSLPSFDDAAEAAPAPKAAPAQTPAPAPVRTGEPYGAAAVPGAQLDIRV